MQLFNHELIRSKGRTAYSLAKQLNMSDLSLYSIVSGKRVPHLSTARALSSAIGIGLDDLQFVGELTKGV